MRIVDAFKCCYEYRTNTLTCIQKWNSLRKPKTKRFQMELENIYQEINGKTKIYPMFDLWLFVSYIFKYSLWRHWSHTVDWVFFIVKIAVRMCVCLCMLCLFDFVYMCMCVVLQYKINPNNGIECKISTGYIKCVTLIQKPNRIASCIRRWHSPIQSASKSIEYTSPVLTEGTERNIVNVGLFGWSHWIWPL